MLTLERPIKTILAISILFSLFALPARSQLKDADFDKIRLIVKDEIAESEKRFDEKLRASEARTKEYIDLKVEHINEKVDHISKQINIQMESIDERLSLITTFVVALIALIVLAVGIPQILMMLRNQRDASLEKQIETLAQEIEILKQQRIV